MINIKAWIHFFDCFDDLTEDIAGFVLKVGRIKNVREVFVWRWKREKLVEQVGKTALVSSRVDFFHCRAVEVEKLLPVVHERGRGN